MHPWAIPTTGACGPELSRHPPRRHASVRRDCRGCDHELLEPLAVRFEGDHLVREPLDHLRAENFEIEQLIRSKLGIVGTDRRAQINLSLGDTSS